jgi:hypothetical protein
VFPASLAGHLCNPCFVEIQQADSVCGKPTILPPGRISVLGSSNTRVGLISLPRCRLLLRTTVAGISIHSSALVLPSKVILPCLYYFLFKINIWFVPYLYL